MSQRLRLYDLRSGELPAIIGLCKGDVQLVAQAVNAVQQRLIYAFEAGEEGWFGTWAEMVFEVNATNPYLTCPREVARLEAMTVCNRPTPIQNQFFEYLQFGNGTLTSCSHNACDIVSAYSRNNAVTFVDLTAPPKLIRAYYTNTADIGKNVLLQGLDNNNTPIYSVSALGNVQGVFLKLNSPFETAPMPFNKISGIQKDITVGQVRIVQADIDTGEEITLLTMEPGEQTASYRRYFLNQLPANCCRSTTGTVQVKAIAKLELLPVRVDTDYCLIQNEQAFICEAQAARLSKMDSKDAKTQAQEQHLQAIRLLQGELSHYLGILKPAVSFKPFGSASLERVNISMI